MDDEKASVRATEPLDILALPLMAVLSYVSLVPYPFVRSVAVAGVPVLRLIPFGAGIAVTAILAVRYFINRGRPVSHLYLAGMVLVFVGVELLSAMGSVEPIKSITKVAFYTVTGVAFYFAAGGLNKRSASAVLWTVVSMSFLVGAVSIIEFFTGRVPFYYRDYLQNNPYMPDPDLVGRSFSTIGHPVFLGAFFILTIPAGYFLFQTGKKPYHKAAAILFASVALAGLFFTFSRGAYLAAIVSAFVFFRRKINIKKAGVAVLVLALALAGLVAVSDKARDTLERRNPYRDYVQQFESAHRIKAFELTARVLGDVPILGMGIGNYRLLYEKYRAPGDDTRAVYATPDNMYLVTLAELGLLGIGLFVYILYSASKAFKTGYGMGPDGAMLLMGLSMLAGFAIDMFFFDALYVEPIRVVFWTLMGLACKDAGAEAL